MGNWHGVAGSNTLGRMHVAHPAYLTCKSVDECSRWDIPNIFCTRRSNGSTCALASASLLTMASTACWYALRSGSLEASSASFWHVCETLRPWNDVKLTNSSSSPVSSRFTATPKCVTTKPTLRNFRKKLSSRSAARFSALHAAHSGVGNRRLGSEKRAASH